MEEKINNKKIFSYIPSLVARLIINSSLQDKDIFSDTTNLKSDKTEDSICGTQSKGRSTFLTSFFINPSIYPINHYLSNTIVMNIRLKGFQKLISTLSVKDPNDQREKMISEYLSIITPRVLLEISKIISNNGGEIIKYNDYEFTTIWNFTPKKNKLLRYQKFYAKQALLSAYQIMKEVDNKEITSGITIKISIGIAMGKTMIGFFGGERKRGEYIVMGETIQKAEICLNYCLSHETIISKEINDLFIGSEEISIKEVDNEENFNLYLITYFNENALKNFKGFKIKMNYDQLKMSKSVYENLAKKVYIFSSILPQGLVKYLDVNQDQNLKEINVVTIATIHLLMNKSIINNLKKIQNIILDIQKATYLTFGSLLYISKTYTGLLIRCVWGMDPGSFVDDTARCISSSILIGSLSEHYDMKIAIGIATGSCYSGLIPIQGDRKQFTILGKKVNLSRTLADEALQTIINSKNTSGKKKFAIYCDKKTMKQSQKWYRYVYNSEIKIYFNKESQELYYETKHEFNYDNKDKVRLEKIKDNYKKKLNTKKNFIRYNRITRNNAILLREYNRKSTENFKKNNSINDSLLESTHVISNQIYNPVDNEEYYIQNINDPFPYIRTHKHNCYSTKIKQYFLNHFKNIDFDSKIKINLVGNLPLPNVATQEDKEKMHSKFQKSMKIFGYDEEIGKFLNIMNIVTQKSKKQFMLVKGPLGAGKSLFVRTCLNKYLEKNEELRRIYFNQDDFILCGIVDPLTATFPYNTFSFILRKIFLYLKKFKKLKEINKICEDLKLNNENVKNINFILSMGKKDINIREKIEPDIDLEIEFRRRRQTYSVRKNSIIKNGVSVINELEGPHKFKDSNKINDFFFQMIRLYKNYLNKKYDTTKTKNRGSMSKKKNKVPLILLIDDVQMSDKYSIDFISYLFNNSEKRMNPFIMILVEQTPFNKNFRPIKHRELEFFLSTFSDLEDNENIGNDKIILFDIKPIMEKDLLKNIIIENFRSYVTKNYPYPTKLESVDSKILDFILMKTFLGIPLLVIELFDCLIKSQKFIQMIDNEYKITQALLDDNDVFDWSDILLPYIYEKITSKTINSLLSFKEILLLKYACTIGTIFDIQTLDKINPLNLIIKKEDLINIMEKLCNEYIIEIFENENINRKTNKNLICKICFPLMREVLHGKFPIERRAILHAETAKLYSAGKKMFYMNTKLEGKILNRHLMYSEINIVNEIESKTNQDNMINSYTDTKITKANNLTVLFVKDICSRIFDKTNKYILEGNIDMLEKSIWIKIHYYVDRKWNIYINKINKNKNEKDLELMIPIKEIFKNRILENNILELTIAEYSYYLLNKSKTIVFLHSDSWQDIFHLNTALTFLRMIANYEKYIYNIGYMKFPLYKNGWYDKKEKKYYANIDQNQLYYNDFRHLRTKRFLSCFGLLNQTDKLIIESKDLNKPFNILMRVSFSLLIANIQYNICKNKNDFLDDFEEEYKLIHGNIVYLIYIYTPPHMRVPIQKVIDELEKKRKEEEELLKLKYKSKFSSSPFSLIKRERRVFGSGIIVPKRNQSIITMKSCNLGDDKKDFSRRKNFIGRKTIKSRTVIDRNEATSKEIVNKVKSTRDLRIINLIDKDSEESSSESFSDSQSDKISEEKSESYNFDDSQSSSNTSDLFKEVDKKDELKKNKLDNKINNIKIEEPEKTENNKKIDSNTKKKNSIIKNDKNENNNIENNNIKKNIINNNYNNKIINVNNFNMNNSNNRTNINNKNNYNINNYINNNISINLINNNYLDSSLNHTFLNKKILNNYYEPNLKIDINSLRMSYQKLRNKSLNKIKPKVYHKKSYSAEVKSLKEKYRNNSNSNHKLYIDEDEEENISSDDKECENNVTKLYLVTNPQINLKKKNKKETSHITPTKDNIFSKAINAVLGEENKEKFKPNKNDIDKINKINNKKNNKDFNKFKFRKISSNIANDKNILNNNLYKKLGKRSSFSNTLKFEFKNRNRHVTFTEEKDENVETKQENDQNKDFSEIKSKYDSNLTSLENKNNNNN